MRVLHISDLHRTSPESNNLDTIWIRVKAALEDNKEDTFDAIIISGDLSDQASVDEYKQTLSFIHKNLLPLVDGERHRIVVVPGNHDVAWKEPSTLQPLDFNGDGVAVLQRNLKLHKWYGRSEVRMHVTDAGHIQWFKRAGTLLYNKRFANVQTHLIDLLYTSVEEKFLRKMNLLGEESDHWSAHVFEDHKTVIVGLNSCAYNDRLWTGAEISTAAVTEVSNYLDREVSDEYLRVAVWHHPVSGSDPARPDYLKPNTPHFITAAQRSVALVIFDTQGEGGILTRDGHADTKQELGGNMTPLRRVDDSMDTGTLALIEWGIADAVRKERTRLGLTQQTVAKRAGIDPSYISRLENASSDISVQHLLRIFRGLGLRLSSFIPRGSSNTRRLETKGNVFTTDPFETDENIFADGKVSIKPYLYNKEADHLVEFGIESWYIWEGEGAAELEGSERKEGCFFRPGDMLHLYAPRKNPTTSYTRIPPPSGFA